MFVPSGDVIWGRPVLVHRVFIKIARVQVRLYGGGDGGLQASLSQAWQQERLLRKLSRLNVSYLPNWIRQTICVSGYPEFRPSGSPVFRHCCLYKTKGSVKHPADQLTFQPAKLLDQLLGPGRDVPRKVNGVNSLEDDVVSFHGVGASEGWGAGQKFKHENPERPVVGRNIVALVQNHFWRYILGCPAECPSFPTNLNSDSNR